MHTGAIVATMLSKLTASCHYTAFFTNEGRELEMLSSGCAVGIACTFSAPVGGIFIIILIILIFFFSINITFNLIVF